jgi:hypothetical protein
MASDDDSRQHQNSSTDYAIRVVGINHYLDNILDFFGKRGLILHYDDITLEAEAELRAEPNNEFDPNAVAIYLDNNKVGHLARRHAALMTQKMRKLGIIQFVKYCGCKIEGVYEKQLGRYYFEVYLKLEIETVRKVEDISPTKFRFSIIDSFILPDDKIPEIGSKISLGQARDDRLRIFVRANHLAFDERLGFVAADAAERVAAHLEAGGWYNAFLVGKIDDSWIVECELIPLEYRDRILAEGQRERRERMGKALSVPYKPKKPLRVTIRRDSIQLKIGDRLLVEKLPSIETMIEEYGSLPIGLMKLESGECFESAVRHEVVEKLFRLSLRVKGIALEVTSFESDSFYNLCYMESP